MWEKEIFKNAATAWGSSLKENKETLTSKDAEIKKAAQNAIEGKFKMLLEKNSKLRDFTLSVAGLINKLANRLQTQKTIHPN